MAAAVPEAEQSDREGVGVFREEDPGSPGLGVDALGEPCDVSLELVPARELNSVPDGDPLLGDDGIRISPLENETAESVHPGRFSVMNFAMLRIEAKIS